MFETAGADALPIVSLISGLGVGITALEAAEPWPDSEPRSSSRTWWDWRFRELGRFAAIMVAGRSGSAFAAEIGR